MCNATEVPSSVDSKQEIDITFSLSLVVGGVKFSIVIFCGAPYAVFYWTNYVIFAVSFITKNLAVLGLRSTFGLRFDVTECARRGQGRCRSITEFGGVEATCIVVTIGQLSVITMGRRRARWLASDICPAFLLGRCTSRLTTTGFTTSWCQCLLNYQTRSRSSSRVQQSETTQRCCPGSAPIWRQRENRLAWNRIALSMERPFMLTQLVICK